MKVGAKGERGGARVSKARAGRDIDVEHEGSGEARVDRTAAGRDIRVSSRGGADPAVTDPVASVQRSRAGRDIVVNVYGKVPQSLRGHVRDREFLPLINDRARGFIGRRFVFEELDRQLAGLRSGYVTVLGEPGIGKTALAAHLVATRGSIHHFNIASAGISSHEAFLGNVCAQLVGRFELEVQHLPDHALEDAGFMTGLLDEAARASGEPVVIVVDALDEAAPAQVERGGNPAAAPPVLPEGVFFVVTSREQHDDGLYADDVRQIVIYDDDPRNRADLCALADRELRPEWPAAWDMTKAELVEHLVDRSEGNFQYLRLVLGEMAERDGPVDLPRVASSAITASTGRRCARSPKRNTSSCSGRYCFTSRRRAKRSTWSGWPSGPGWSRAASTASYAAGDRS